MAASLYQSAGAGVYYIFRAAFGKYCDGMFRIFADQGIFQSCKCAERDIDPDHFYDDFCGDILLQSFHDGCVCDGIFRNPRIFYEQDTVFHVRDHSGDHPRRDGGTEFQRCADDE